MCIVKGSGPMRQIIRTFLHKKAALITLTSLVTGAAIAGLMIFASPTTQAASSCTQDPYPETNIMYCGLSGGTNTAQAIQSFQSYYKQNSDKSAANTANVHTDLQTIYNYSGANSGLVNSMNTSNTFLATSYSDGTIKLSNGTVVGTDMQIGARGTWFSSSDKSKYTLLPGTKDVYMRSYSTYFMPDNIKSVPTLVHINPATGAADFAVWELCGNNITFKPVQPAHSLSCSFLTPHEDGSTDTQLSYTFTVQAAAKYVAISGYYFDFGDGQQQTVTTSQLTASASHTFNRTDAQQTITINALVNSSVTSATCATQIIVPPQPPKQESSLACTNIQKASDGTNTYIFTGNAAANNTTITKYVFDFGDGTSETVTTGSTTATSKPHTYKYRSNPYTAQVTVTGPLGSFTKDACTVPIQPSKTAVKAASTLVNTGPGSVVAIFGIAATAGTLLYRTLLRRKLSV